MKKRSFILTVVLLLAVLLVPRPTLAAETLPVYLDGQKLPGQALVRSGVSYLPMRVIYEAMGAQVQWDAKGQTVYAVLPNGHTAKIPVKGEWAEVTYHEGNEVYTVRSANLEGRRPFTQNGKVYLPVRLVADMLGYEVDYNGQRVALATPKLTYKDAAGGVYTLNLLSGELSLGGKQLSVIDLPSIDNPDSWYLPRDFKVSKTVHGNYLFETGGIGSGALTFSYSVTAWIPGEALAQSRGKKIVQACASATWGDVSKPVIQGDMIYLPDNNQIIHGVNDANGFETMRGLNDIYGEESFYNYRFVWWANDRFAVIGSDEDFDVYDMLHNKLYRMQDELITEELKAKINKTMLKKSIMRDDEDLDYWWKCFGATALHAADMHCAYFRFDPNQAVGKDGTLHFELYAKYWAEDDGVGDELITTLYFKLPE